MVVVVAQRRGAAHRRTPKLSWTLAWRIPSCSAAANLLVDPRRRRDHKRVFKRAFVMVAHQKSSKTRTMSETLALSSLPQCVGDASVAARPCSAIACPTESVFEGQQRRRARSSVTLQQQQRRRSVLPRHTPRTSQTMVDAFSTRKGSSP